MLGYVVPVTTFVSTTTFRRTLEIAIHFITAIGLVFNYTIFAKISAILYTVRCAFALPWTGFFTKSVVLVFKTPIVPTPTFTVDFCFVAIVITIF
jgi:hypothetical protein